MAALQLHNVPAVSQNQLQDLVLDDDDGTVQVSGSAPNTSPVPDCVITNTPFVHPHTYGAVYHRCLGGAAADRPNKLGSGP
jgi:hypothetical protein